MFSRQTIIGGLLVACSASVAAQQFELVDEAQLPRFEVASITPGNPNAPDGRLSFPPGRFVQDNKDMDSALHLAFFGVWPYQLPTLQHVLQERYSIDARMPAGASIEARNLMIRALLIDRFKMRFHVETREQDGFALTLASGGGQLGPNMRQSAVDCVARTDGQRRNQPVPPISAGREACGMWGGPGRFDMSGMSLSLLLQNLEIEAGRPVVNRTNLVGAFDVTLRWASSVPRPANPGGPSLFTAIEEQLGLRLEPGNVPVDYLVIDHIERPQPD